MWLKVQFIFLCNDSNVYDLLEKRISSFLRMIEPANPNANIIQCKRWHFSDLSLFSYVGLDRAIPMMGRAIKKMLNIKGFASNSLNNIMYGEKHQMEINFAFVSRKWNITAQCNCWRFEEERNCSDLMNLKMKSFKIAISSG